MPTFIAQGRFTRDSVRGMLQTPEDRTEPVAKLFESLGAKLISWYMTAGDYDWMLIVEAPDQGHCSRRRNCGDRRRRCGGHQDGGGMEWIRSEGDLPEGPGRRLEVQVGGPTSTQWHVSFWNHKHPV